MNMPEETRKEMMREIAFLKRSVNRIKIMKSIDKLEYGDFIEIRRVYNVPLGDVIEIFPQLVERGLVEYTIIEGYSADRGIAGKIYRLTEKGKKINKEI